MVAHVRLEHVWGVLFGPAIATYRFFDTLNKIERKLNENNGYMAK